MSFGEHLDDLRRRVVIGLLGLVPIFALALFFGDRLLELLLVPVQDQLRAAGLPTVLQATSPFETFGAYFRVAIIATVLVGAPWLLGQLWMFVAPGLYAHERRFAYLLIPLSVALTAAGVVFLYTVMLPVMLAFFIGFGSTVGQQGVLTAPLPEGITLPSIPILEADPIAPEVGQEWINSTLKERRVCLGATPAVGDAPATYAVYGTPLTLGAGIVQQYRVREYIGMVFSLALAFALAFQAPIVVLLLGWAGLVDRAFLTKHRKHAVFICVVLAAVLTPADPFSLILLAVPLYLLYELGVVLIGVVPADRVVRGFHFLDRTRGATRAGSEPPDAGDE